MATSTATSKPAAKKAAKAKLTKAQVVAELKRWSKEHDGAVPSSADFWPARLRQYAKAAKTKAQAKQFERQAATHEKAGYPITPQVAAACGGWSGALKAAGMTPKRQSKKS